MSEINNSIKNPEKLFVFLKFVGLLIVSLLIAVGIGVGFKIAVQELSLSMIFEPSYIMSIWVILFLLSMILKINYQSKLFVFDMIMASFLVSFYPFDQAFISVLVLILIQKIIKLI
jgi:hypothetical protein